MKSEHRGTEIRSYTERDFNELTSQVIGAAIEVHKELGPGLLESVYENCLAKELVLRGIRFQQQVQLPVHYKGEKLDREFFVDMVVEDELVLELKAIESDCFDPRSSGSVLLAFGEQAIGFANQLQRCSAERRNTKNHQRISLM